MVGLSSLGLSIVNFFRILWSTFIGLLIYKEKATKSSLDIESGIPVIPILTEFGQDKDITRSVHPEKNFHALSVNGFVEVSLMHNGAVGNDPYSKCPIRRPSRRVSAVDPVKSRIMEATLKHVQDKTINVVKTVNLTPASDIAMPCSAKIEYYDPRTDSPNIRFGTINNRTKAVPRGVEYDLPPILVEDTFSTAENKETGRMKERESISDLLDLFPLPPAFIPKPPPAVTRSIGNPTNPLPITFRPSSLLSVTRESGEYSDTETIASLYSSESFSDGTADTSLAATPTSITDAVMASHQNTNVVEEKSSLSAASSIYHSTEILSTSDTVEFKPQNDGIALPVYAVDESDPCIPMPTNIKNDIETWAHSQKCDIHDVGCFKQRKDARANHATIQDMLTTSCSENAMVDSLFAQLETSFELDQKEAVPFSKEKDLFFAGRVFPDIRAFPPIINSVAPLNIVRKQQARSCDDEVEHDVDTLTSTWEHSLEKVLKAFKEAEADDLDLHDLFYKDSSLFSQSSLVCQPQGTLEEESITSAMFDCEIFTLEQPSDEQVDESFESSDQSMEEPPSTPKLNDVVTAAVAQEHALANISVSIKPIAEDLVSDVVKTTSDPTKTDPSLSNDAPNDIPYTTWLSGRHCDDDDDDDETDTELEGEDDQWSNIFELNAYTT